MPSILILGLAACSDPASTGPPAASTPSSAAPSTETPAEASPTASETSEDAGCTIFGADSSIAILASSWSIAVAAKGESDAGKHAIKFADDAKDFYDDVHHEDSCEGSQATVDAAALNFEATLLATPFRFDPPSDPDPDQYQKVADAGNTLASTFGVEGVKFISPKCHGKVEETAPCTPLE